jgi:hypothetical protein
VQAGLQHGFKSTKSAQHDSGMGSQSPEMGVSPFNYHNLAVPHQIKAVHEQLVHNVSDYNNAHNLHRSQRSATLAAMKQIQELTPTSATRLPV